MKRLRQRVKNALLYALARGLIAALRTLPVPLVLALGPPLGRLAHLLAVPERRRARRNLEAAWPWLSAGLRRRLVRRMFVGLGRSAAECLALPRLASRLGTSRSPCRLTPEAEGVLLESLAQGRGVILVTAHYGNWELMAAALARLAPLAVLARPSYDPRFTRLIDAERRRHGVRSLWIDGPAHLRGAVRTLRAGQVLGVLLDQPVDAGERLPFLGRPALTSSIVGWLARLTGSPVVVGTVSAADRRGTITLESLPSCAPEELTRACLATLERAIARDPAAWLWSLDRWRAARRKSHASSASPTLAPCRKESGSQVQIAYH
ncbi:MAG: hypothetical protein IT371_24805 [Deltaproteobacteria bacterium]|nr:hypothetical protein [Deltaproteobacteria bacterium]